MKSIGRFEDLEIWQLARNLNKSIYQVIHTTQLKNDLILRNQLERSAGSVMDNIAEGFEREGNKELIHFLSIAKGSCGELRSQLYRVRDRGYIQEGEFMAMDELSLIEIKRIHSFMGYLKKTSLKGSKFK
ncbi:four helix bundle protein [Zeaxanthinibacter enoshimensis]|uniref:four helix bundle protein n=1 Tax=Zeaxanthinibacter enoshimensis TaxID=392009 RepID=UPI0035617F8F